MAVAVLAGARRRGPRDRYERCGGLVHRAGGGSAGDVRVGRVKRGGGGGDLSASRWDSVGDRVSGSEGGVDVAAGDQRPARRAVPAANRWSAQRGGTSSDVAGDRRLVVFAARGAATGG